MPVPSTKGVLRTNLNEMKIGDYIKAWHENGSGTTYNPSTMVLNPSSTKELSTGSYTSANDGFFYFVKVDKGILIADRVLMHSATWDVLNTAKVIQGCSNVVSATPKMSSNTSPDGKISASSIYTTAYDAWKAFNKFDDGEGWCTASGTKQGWLAFEFNTPKKIAVYAVKGGNSASPYQASKPKNWTFEASNDGLNWDILDAQSNQTSWNSYEKRTFPISNNNSYLIYRINISDNNGHGYTEINEFELFEVDHILRSLTGGVAWADANGNYSTTDAGFGAWPVINEWDKYIANFPSGKIQTGKTLDDVFHSNGIWTWTQDTPAQGVKTNVTNASGVSANRVYRHLNDPTYGKWFHLASTTAVSGVGFRPVIEYKEV